MENILLFLLILTVFVAAWQTERLNEAKYLIKLHKGNTEAQREETVYWLQSMAAHRNWGDYWEPFCIEIERHGLSLRKLTRLLNTDAKRRYKKQYSGPFTFAKPTIQTNSRGMFSYYLGQAANQRNWFAKPKGDEAWKRVSMGRPSSKKAHAMYIGKAQSLNTQRLPA